MRSSPSSSPTCAVKPRIRFAFVVSGIALEDVLVLAGQLVVGNDLGPQRHRDIERALHGLGEVDDARRVLAADVEHLATCLGRHQRAVEALDGVVDVGERADLRAVAVDLHHAAVEQDLGERRLGAAPPARVVARAVGAEEAQERDLQAALLCERQADVLVEQLRDRVRPAAGGRRPEHEVVVLRERRGRVAVDVGGGRDDQVRVLRQRSVGGRVDAGHVRLERHQRSAVARDLLRGEMDDRIAAVERRPQFATARAIHLLEREVLVGERELQVRERAARQIVHTNDRHALCEQTVAEMRPDVAGGAGDADFLHGVSLLHTTSV